MFSTWCVNDVDVMILPHGVCSSWLDSDASLSLQFHRVHGGTNTIFPLHLDAAQEENAHCRTLHTCQTSPDNKRAVNTQTRSQRSPRESLLSCLCNIGYARSGWSSPSRCGLRSRCCGSSRWERHQRSMSDSCWWAPADETEDNRYSHPFLSVYRLCNAKGRQQSSSVEGRFQRTRPIRLPNITFLTVTLLVDKRCVFAKERPAFSTLILTPAWSTKEWSYSSFYTTPDSESPVNVTPGHRWLFNSTSASTENQMYQNYYWLHLLKKWHQCKKMHVRSRKNFN